MSDKKTLPICRHCEHSFLDIHKHNVYECRHPRIDTREQHYITGERKGDAPTCENTRKNRKQCGMSARLYSADTLYVD